MTYVIERVDAVHAAALMPDLSDLLQDTVHSGASIGFIPPLNEADAIRYWQEVCAAVKGHTRVLLIARSEKRVIGSVQLDLCMRPNGMHRAEVIKLMVHTAYRRRGIGCALMMMAESEARKHDRSLLVLDTRQGDPSEHLYKSIAYTLVGTIPQYARSADGSLHTTAIYYKLL